MLEPWSVVTKVEFSDWLYARAEKSFKNELTNILLNVLILTESSHSKYIDLRIVWNDLSEQIDHLKPSYLCKIIHDSHL